MKKLVLILTGVLAVAGIFVFRIINKGPVDIHKADALEVEAGTLYDVYLGDSAKAAELYTARVLEVSGEVSSVVAGDKARPPVVLLRTSKDNAFINCTFQQSSGLPEKGSRVRIRGICSGMGEADTDLGIFGDVYLERCITNNQ